MNSLKRDNKTKCCDNCVFYEWYYSKYYNVGGDLVEIKVSVKIWGVFRFYFLKNLGSMGWRGQTIL